MQKENGRMRFVTGTLAFIICLFSACSLQADTFVDPQFFLQQKLEVYGLAGTPWESEPSYDEERSRAWMDALHHAYETILELPLMEGKQVKHVLQTNAALKERLGLVLMSAPKTFFQPDLSGLSRCRVEIPMNGKLSLRSALYLAALRPQPMQPVDFLASWSAGLRLSEKPKKPLVTRVVIDVRDFDFEPCLFPRFFDAAGMLIFQEAMIPSPERFSRPVVRFMTDITAAREGVNESESCTIAAYVNELCLRDIAVEHADAQEFAHFCRDLVQNPLQKREIVVVFDPGRDKKAGRLGKSEKKADESAVNKQNQEAKP